MSSCRRMLFGAKYPCGSGCPSCNNKRIAAQTTEIKFLHSISAFPNEPMGMATFTLNPLLWSWCTTQITPLTVLAQRFRAKFYHLMFHPAFQEVEFKEWFYSELENLWYRQMELKGEYAPRFAETKETYIKRLLVERPLPDPFDEGDCYDYGVWDRFWRGVLAPAEFEADIRSIFARGGVEVPDVQAVVHPADVSNGADTVQFKTALLKEITREVRSELVRYYTDLDVAAAPRQSTVDDLNRLAESLGMPRVKPAPRPDPKLLADDVLERSLIVVAAEYGALARNTDMSLHDPKGGYFKAKVARSIKDPLYDGLLPPSYWDADRSIYYLHPHWHVLFVGLPMSVVESVTHRVWSKQKHWFAERDLDIDLDALRADVKYRVRWKSKVVDAASGVETKSGYDPAVTPPRLKKGSFPLGDYTLDFGAEALATYVASYAFKSMGLIKSARRTAWNLVPEGLAGARDLGRPLAEARSDELFEPLVGKPVRPFGYFSSAADRADQLNLSLVDHPDRTTKTELYLEGHTEFDWRLAGGSVYSLNIVHTNDRIIKGGKREFDTNVFSRSHISQLVRRMLPNDLSVIDVLSDPVVDRLAVLRALAQLRTHQEYRPFDPSLRKVPVKGELSRFAPPMEDSSYSRVAYDLRSARYFLQRLDRVRFGLLKQIAQFRYAFSEDRPTVDSVPVFDVAALISAREAWNVYNYQAGVIDPPPFSSDSLLVLAETASQEELHQLSVAACVLALRRIDPDFLDLLLEVNTVVYVRNSERLIEEDAELAAYVMDKRSKRYAAYERRKANADRRSTLGETTI